MGDTDGLLTRRQIVQYATKILKGSEEHLHRTLRLSKLSDYETVRKAGGQRLVDEFEKDSPSITHAQLVDIVLDHVNEHSIMQSSVAPLTMEQTDALFNEVDPSLSEEVKSMQHGRFDSKRAKSSSKRLSLQSIHRQLTKKSAKSD